MKKHFKIVLTVATALALSIGMVGCGEKSPDEITEKEVEQALSSLDEEYGEKNDTKSNTESNKGNSIEIVYAPTQEILDADFDSGLIQIGNDVFQTGGYITVREFVELYKDDYEETVVNSTDELHGIFSGDSELLVKEKPQTFYIMPKKYDTNYKNSGIRVRCENKLTVEKGSIYDALVVSVNKASVYENAIPTWYPKGFNLQSIDNNKESDYHINYLADDFPGFLESQGIDSEGIVKKGHNGWDEKTDYYYFEDYNNCYVAVFTANKENLNGNILKYTYYFYFSEDTDKFEYARNNTYFDFSTSYFYPILKQSIIE